MRMVLSSTHHSPFTTHHSPFTTHHSPLTISLPLQDEGVVQGLVAVDGILGQGTLSPGIDPAHAVDVQVDIKIDKTATLDVLRMTGMPTGLG